MTTWTYKSRETQQQYFIQNRTCHKLSKLNSIVLFYISFFIFAFEDFHWALALWKQMGDFEKFNRLNIYKDALNLTLVRIRLHITFQVRKKK